MTDRTDNFDRADTTNAIGTPSDAGGNWTQQSGTWGIASNKGYQSAAAPVQVTCVLETSITNVEVQVTLSTFGSDCGVLSRAQNDSNYILGAATSGTGFRIFKRVAGAFTQIGSTAGTPATGDVIKLTSDAANLHTLLQNGVSRCSGTDAAGSANTLCGLRIHNENTTRFDDFSAAAPGGAPAATGYLNLPLLGVG